MSSSSLQFGDVFPFPNYMDVAESAGLIGMNADLQFNGPDNEVLKAAFDRTVENIKNDKFLPLEADSSVWANVPECASISAMEFSIKNADADLQHGVNESYTLNIADNNQVSVTAETVWGALHALNTFEQLVLYQSEKDKIFVEGPVSIVDEPKYPYRGLMIDTARNFFTVEALCRHVDALAAAKMNVLHWHLSDTQSWPIFIKSHPEMTKDAYSPAETYQLEDVKKVVEYARARGVRVIPELDLPGHSYSGWRQINKDIVSCGDYDGPWSDVAGQPNPGQLDIANDATYTALKDVYDDVSEMFPDQFFHVGGDELHSGCYNKSENIQNWLSQEDGRTLSDLVQHWLDKALPIFKNRDGRKLVMWADIVFGTMPAHDLSKDVILQSWTDGVENVKEAAAKGYDVIISSSDFLYLSCGIGGWNPGDPRLNVQKDPSPGEVSVNYGGNGGAPCAPFKSWQRMYNYDWNSQLTPEEQKHIIGGSTALWSEQMDGHAADPIAWPRTASLGELLWSGNKDENGNLRVKDASRRLANFRERLVNRGVSAAPILPKYCAKNPGKCDYEE
jgi:hexosaminidase